MLIAGGQMSDRAAQLIFELHKGQSQFAYFQLGVAASAMAFAIHETAGVALADAPWPLGVAVLLWALSFALGCFGLDARQTGLLSNAAFLQAVHEVRVQFPRVNLAEITSEAKETVAKDLSKPVRRFRWQKWLLFAGALAYIAGHVMQMAALPPKAVLTMGQSSTSKA
jgi:hypothetical protein